uniref:Ig-like domain-containing protein n=1 Tax=Dicentrarchus labrax TaxID=13489 RepID=A0A8C4DMP4_DICLA
MPMLNCMSSFLLSLLASLVSISPNLKHIFSGDLLFLSCGDSGTSVKWYFNDNEVKTQTYKTWKIAVATSKNTGSYQCESNGQKSEIFSIEVLEFKLPKLHSSVILMLENDAGLQAWRCWVFRGTETKKIMLRLEKSSTNVVFQPRELTVSETIFWCTDKQEQLRSNQIIVRTSGKEVSLEMDPLPAVAGESLTLSCLVWGTDQITHTVFYKNGTILLPNAKFTHTISKVTESDQGSYKCKAIFTYVAQASMKADLSENIGMSCRCSHCPSDASYNWYRKKDDGQLWQFLENNNGLMMPKESGTYGCRAVFRNGMSFFSNSHVCEFLLLFLLMNFDTFPYRHINKH